jgi:hypothetical protein
MPQLAHGPKIVLAVGNFTLRPTEYASQCG